MNNSQALLLAARTLIANKKHWIQGTEVEVLNESAVYDVFSSTEDLNVSPTECAFCATGAVRFVAGGAGLGPRTVDIALNRLNEAANELYGNNKKVRKEIGLDEGDTLDAIAINDTLSHNATLRMFDRALELAGSQRVR